MYLPYQKAAEEKVLTTQKLIKIIRANVDLTKTSVAKVNELTFFDKSTDPANKTSSAIDISQLIISL